jgi:hypothetical protein
LFRADLLEDKRALPIAFRFVGMAASLAANIIVAKQLDLEQIAYYFLYVTLSYFGNAALFVGMSIALQRCFSTLAASRQLNKTLLVRYLSVSLAIGVVVVAIVAVMYLSARSAAGNVWSVAVCCATLSGATYLSAAAKDLLALGNRLSIAALFSFLEQVLRLFFIVLVLIVGHKNAIEVSAAVAAGSALSGIAAIATLLFSFERAPSSATDAISFGRIAHTVGPIGFSGILNWLQLQSYRPILLYFGTRPELVGIAALLTSLGMAGANPVLAVTAQRFIPSLYAGEATAFRACMLALARVALVLAACSIPAAFAFLFLSGRRTLVLYLLLVPIGVFVEAGNNVIGAVVHRQNSLGGSMWRFAAAGAIGVLVMGLFWFAPVRNELIPYCIGVGMIASQIAVVATVAAISKVRC